MNLKGTLLRGFVAVSLIFSISVEAATKRANGSTESCEAQLTTPKWTLQSFLTEDPEKNLAVQHPFTIANAAEKAYAMITHVPPREARDPLYRVKPTKIYPMLAGEHPAAGGRMVVGQEDAIEAFVATLHSAARGDRSGKTLGFPGPAGTGKTELLYVLDNLEKNLGREAKYRQYSYRWRNLHEVPRLKMMFRYDPQGKPIEPYLDPDLPRSPFTLLRADMKARVLKFARPEIRRLHNLTIADGWMNPEPKSEEILRILLEHKYPDLAEGERVIEDLTEEEYLSAIMPYLVIVPKTTLRPPRAEPQLVRAQTENPNQQTLFVAPNIARGAYYGFRSALGVDYTGKVMQQDGGLLMFDELFRNGGEFLNTLLEVIQNHIVESDFGMPVHLDIVPVWNSNDESIEKAGEDNAIKALLNRTDAPAMRSLLPPNQIESVILFQIGLDRFKMRKLEDNELVEFEHSAVYPPTDADGRTYSSSGRYALYYEMEDQEILVAPHTLSYVAWLAAATRFVTDMTKINAYGEELNTVRANHQALSDEIERVKIAIGENVAELAELHDLSRLRDLLKEGQSGISARDIETWIKEALQIAKNRGAGVLTPTMVDVAFAELLDENRIKPSSDKIRADWQRIRARVKLELLLPKLQEDVKTILSGDGHKAERIYDEIEREFITLASNAEATEVYSENGSQRMVINRQRLDEIRSIYREKYRRDFEPNFLLRQLASARAGKGMRNPQLLEAVKIFIARTEAKTADYTAFEQYYNGQSGDPAIRQRALEIEALLPSYGYDVPSFREALTLMSQLEQAPNLAKRPRQ